MKQIYSYSLRSVDLKGNLLRGLPPLLNWRSNMMKDFIASNNQIASVCKPFLFISMLLKYKVADEF